MSRVTQSSESHSSVTLVAESELPMFGCKGPQAESWLRSEGYSAPAVANTWQLNARGTLTARLGSSEFVVGATPLELDRVVASNARLQSLDAVENGVYWVCRQDTILQLSGSEAREVLLECCSFDFRLCPRGGDHSSGQLILTLVAGVSVLVMPEFRTDGMSFAIWCDPSFAHYLTNKLSELIDNRARAAVAVSGPRSSQ